MTTTELIGWAAVEEAAKTAKGIAFDGCHKVYVAMDDEQYSVFHGYGYGDGSDDSRLIYTAYNSPDVVYDILRDWYEGSCGLRFISAVATTPNPNDGFRDLIPQCYDPDLEEWV